jgi:F-type H+-transporting ATPase subunit O
LADGGRLQETDKTIKAFKKLMAAHRKEVSAVVTAAHELDAEELAMAKKAIEAKLKPGETVTLTTAIDPRLIGGVTIQMGDKFVDLSIARQIKDIEKLLNEPM